MGRALLLFCLLLACAVIFVGQAIKENRHGATASGAAMNNIQFDGAYLFGFDFTNAQIHGLQFANAVLVGVNFGGATLSVNSILVFRCLLEGTNLAAATLQENISLADSFVDFSALSNVMYLVLSADHAVFPGYWRAPGKTVCAEMSYSGPSIVPANNPAITCPDGSSN